MGLTEQEKLNALQDFSQLLSAGESANILLDTVIELALKEFGPSEVTIVLLDYMDNSVIAAKKMNTLTRQTLGDEGQALSLPPTDQISYKEINALTIAQDERQTLIRAPLLTGGRRWGLLTIQSDNKKENPSNESIKFLSSLTSLAALAIENRNKFLMTTQRRARSEPTDYLHDCEIGTELTSALQSLANKALKIANADAVLLYEVNKNGDVIIPPIVSGTLLYPDVVRGRGVVINHETSTVFKMIKYGRPFYAENAPKEWEENGLSGPGTGKGFAKRENIKSSAGIPIIMDGQALGVFFVNYRKAQQFTSKARELLEVFADSAGLAIQHAVLAAERDTQVKQVMALNELSREIAKPRLNLSKVLELTINRAVGVAKCDAGICFLVYDSPQGTPASESVLEVVATYNLTLKSPRVSLARGQGVAGIVAEQRRERIDNCYQQNKKHTGCIFNGEPVQCIVGVPILWDETILGVIELLSLKSDRTFSDDDVVLLRHFADLAALAIVKANADSFQEALVRQSPDAIIAVNARGKVTEFNEKAEQLFGYCKSEVQGKSVDYLYWKGREASGYIGELLSESHTVRTPTFVKTKTQGKIPVHLTASLLYDAGKRKLGSIGVMEALRDAPLPKYARRLIEVIERIGKTISIEDASETILLEALDLFCAGTGALFLVDEKKKLSCAATTYSTETHYENFLKTLQDCSPTKTCFWSKENPPPTSINPEPSAAVTIPIIGEGLIIAYLHAECNEIENFGPSRDYFDVLSRQAGLVLTRLQLREFRDKAQKGMLQSANAISAGILATSLIHELRNAFHGISLILENVKNNILLSRHEKALKKIQDIENEIDRIDILAAPLQKSSKLDITPDKRMTYLNDVVREGLSLLRSSFDESNIKPKIKLDIQLDKPKAGNGNTVFADPRQLKQVMINLVLNAIAVTKRRGRIEISTRKFDRSAIFAVRDFGPGIDDEHKNYVFDPFFTTKPDGTGLGLYVSKLIIESTHDGHIDFFSRRPGTEFSFKLNLYS